MYVYNTVMYVVYDTYYTMILVSISNSRFKFVKLFETAK